MKTSLLSLIAVLLLSLQSFAQFKVIEHGVYQFVDGQPVLVEPAGTEDLSGTNIMATAMVQEGDNEHALWMVNETDQTYTTRAIRTELGVPEETYNNVCWGLCPAVGRYAGVEPVWVVGGTSLSFTETLAPGDTATTFAFHHDSKGVVGCSHYRIDIVNENDHTEVLTSFEITFDHSPQANCVTSIDDLSRNLGVTLAPNPARDYMDLSLSGVDVPVEVIVSDLLGHQVSTMRLFPADTQTERINTAEMNNGIYFLSVIAEGQVVRTSKFVVSH